MRVTRATGVVLLALYILFWVIALNGASSFIPLLAVPLILAVLVAFGVWLNRFMGISPRSQHFAERAEVDEASETTPATTEGPAGDGAPEEAPEGPEDPSS